MSPIQIGALLFTVLAPLGVWLLTRRDSAPRLLRGAELALAIALLGGMVLELYLKYRDGDFTLEKALPLQLCDWALILVSVALLRLWKTGFEVAYFWGLAGTFQALLTPDVPADLHWFRVLGFFFLHAGIVAGIVHFLLSRRWRPTPRSLVKVVVASEIFLATALTVNALTGGNYGYLSRKPPTRTMLDLFSDTQWLYTVQLNLVAFVFFAVLYAPWFIADLVRSRRAQPPGAGANPG